MNNPELARIFREIARYLEMDGEMVFKIRAYENAALSLTTITEDVADIYKKGGVKALCEIPAIGKGTALKIEEYLTTRKIESYEQLKAKAPIDLGSLSRIEGLGSKKIKILYEKLGVRNAADLEKAARDGKIRVLAGFGEKSEQKILQALEIKKKDKGRLPLFRIEALVHEIERHLRKLPQVEELVVTGSYRRRKETIGDIDIVVVSQDPKKIMSAFTAMGGVVAIYGQGPTKSTVRLAAGLDADLRVVERKSFGAALNYFTGNKDHNIALRKIAIEKGYKLNEYGVFKGAKQVAGATEEDVYRILGLPFIEPELRENTGEIEAAKKGTLPHLIGYHDLKGDLQIQTNWTDGTSSIETMAQAAQQFGHEYILITDHTKTLAMTGGLDEAKIAQQGKEIDQLNKKFKNITILKGAEVNILKDGSLDISDTCLKQLDIVGAAVHSHFSMTEPEMTKRIEAAMRNPHIDILFHPTGRIVGRREPYAVDMEHIIDVAKDTGTVLEVDALERLDLRDEHVRMAVKAGVKLAIDSDAHAIDELAVVPFGIAQARRGWAEKKDVINAWPLDKMKKMLK